MRKHSFDLKSIELSPEILNSFDCVLISTNHEAFDYEMIKSHSQIIIDTRGVYKEPFSTLVRA